MTALLQAQKIRWQIGANRILEDVSLELPGGSLLGVIGPNGAGKSSLLNILAGIQPPDEGTLLLRGQSYGSFERRRFAQELAYLEQHARVSWPLLTEKVVELGRSPYQHRYAKLGDEDQAAIDLAVSTTGIERLLGRVISTLSLGEQMLVALTRVFAAQPALILADEPVAALDPYHQLLIMELLQNHARQDGDHAALIVLHDLSLAARFCDRLLLMNEGRIVAAGRPAEVLSDENLREFYKINCYSDFEQALIQPLNRI